MHDFDEVFLATLYLTPPRPFSATLLQTLGWTLVERSSVWFDRQIFDRQISQLFAANSQQLFATNNCEQHVCTNDWRATKTNSKTISMSPTTPTSKTNSKC